MACLDPAGLGESSNSGVTSPEVGGVSPTGRVKLVVGSSTSCRERTREAQGQRSGRFVIQMCGTVCGGMAGAMSFGVLGIWHAI